jgi:hyperosmotically inducible periplasmic protein
MAVSRLRSGIGAALALFVLLGSSGCAVVLVGAAAAAGGYYLGKDDRSPARIAEDGTITTRVKSKLVADKYVDAFAINVDTNDGVVTLYGSVGTRFEREQAERLAGSVSGVQRVENRIRVEPRGEAKDQT